MAAAKRGVSCVLDFDANGTNKSFFIDKNSGIATPLIERKKGILEVPVHLYFDKNDEKGLMATDPINPNPEKGQFARNFLANFFKVSQERGCQFARIM